MSQFKVSNCRDTQAPDHTSGQSFHRGAILGNGIVESPCTLEYLYILSIEMHRARAHQIVSFARQLEEKTQLHRLQFVVRELDRLHRYPDLFPSRAALVRFNVLLAIDAELEFIQASKDLLVEDEMRQIDQFSRESYTRVDYVRSSRGWENFLLDSAPGVPSKVLQRTKTVPKSTLQVIPAVGMRIVADLEREEAEIVRFVKQSNVKLEVSPAATTLMINFDEQNKWSERIPELVLPQQTQSIFGNPNPYPEDEKIRIDLLTPNSHQIEEISPLIHRIEQPPPHPHAPIAALTAPNIFPMVTLRSWHPPTRSNELHFEQS